MENCVKKVCVLLIALIFLSNATAFGHAPQAINLEYDAAAGKLHITVEHVSSDIREHFIRMVIVSVNGKEVQAHHLSSQTSPKELDMDVSLKAQPGDIIGVKAVCSKAGYREAQFAVENE